MCLFLSFQAEIHMFIHETIITRFSRGCRHVNFPNVDSIKCMCRAISKQFAVHYPPAEKNDNQRAESVQDGCQSSQERLSLRVQSGVRAVQHSEKMLKFITVQIEKETAPLRHVWKGCQDEASSLCEEHDSTAELCKCDWKKKIHKSSGSNSSPVCSFLQGYF